MKTIYSVYSVTSAATSLAFVQVVENKSMSQPAKTMGCRNQAIKQIHSSRLEDNAVTPLLERNSREYWVTAEDYNRFTARLPNPPTGHTWNSTRDAGAASRAERASEKIASQCLLRELLAPETLAYSNLDTQKSNWKSWQVGIALDIFQLWNRHYAVIVGNSRELWVIRLCALCRQKRDVG